MPKKSIKTDIPAEHETLLTLTLLKANSPCTYPFTVLKKEGSDEQTVHSFTDALETQLFAHTEIKDILTRKSNPPAPTHEHSAGALVQDTVTGDCYQILSVLSEPHTYKALCMPPRRKRPVQITDHLRKEKFSSRYVALTKEELAERAKDMADKIKFYTKKKADYDAMLKATVSC